jgi:hypothetical protein
MTKKYNQNAKFHRRTASAKTIRSIRITFLVSTLILNKTLVYFSVQKSNLKDIWIFRYSNIFFYYNSSATCTLDETDKHFSHKLLLYFAFFVK